MTPSPAQSWVAANFFKLLVVAVLALAALQYTFSTIYESKQLDALFGLNTSAHAWDSARPTRARARGLIYNESASDILPPPPPSTLANSTAAPIPTLAGNSSADTTVALAGRPLCPPIPPDLEGPIKVVRTAPPMPELERRFPMLEPGGRYRPSACQARDRVAVVVSYRDREQHLRVFLANLHPLLQRQQLDYGIFVVEQAGTGPFNRAMLMNVGFVEALKLYDFDCFVFHDVDLLPEDDRNLYTCPEQPRHMSVAVDVFRYKLPYGDLFGGVSALTRTQFQAVNGFSNMFWGWGGEDDDMSNRVKYFGFHISRYPVNIARYKMLTHKKEKPNPKRYQYLNTGQKRFRTDGLNSLRYTRKELTLGPLYTHLLVELQAPS